MLSSAFQWETYRIKWVLLVATGFASAVSFPVSKVAGDDGIIEVVTVPVDVFLLLWYHVLRCTALIIVFVVFSPPYRLR